jgi:uracil-DNA glycosylase family 4
MAADTKNPTASTDENTKASRLALVRKELEDSYVSLPLANSPQEIVPGDGNPEAEIMFIGEAAGRNELIQRRPFVGVSGKLLMREMEKIGYKREDVYISNVVKARPPDNRDPLPEEIEAYRPFLDQEIEIIDPKIIVTLGRFSMAKFIPDVKISFVHGRLHKVKIGSKVRFVVPFFHPAAALRQGKVMEQFQKDVAKLPKILEYVKSKRAEIEELNTIQDALF